MIEVNIETQQVKVGDDYFHDREMPRFSAEVNPVGIPAIYPGYISNVMGTSYSMGSVSEVL